MTIAADGQPMPVACTEIGLPSQVPVYPSIPRSCVPLDGIVEVRLGDVLRAQRVAWEQARLGVVAGLGTDVNRHRQTLS